MLNLWIWRNYFFLAHIQYTRSWSHWVAAFAASVSLIGQDHVTETRKDHPTKN